MAPRIWSSAVTRKAAAPTERRCRISGSGDDGGRPCVGRPIAPATPDLLRGPAGCLNQWCLATAGYRIKSGQQKEGLVAAPNDRRGKSTSPIPEADGPKNLPPAPTPPGSRP